LSEYTVGEFIDDVQKYTKFWDTVKRKVGDFVRENPNDAKLQAAARSVAKTIAEKGPAAVIGAAVGGALGSIVPGLGTAVGGAAGGTLIGALSDVVGELAIPLFKNMKSGTAKMMQQAQVPDDQEKTPYQEILDINDQLESLMKGDEENSELYSAFESFIVKEFEKVQAAILADIEAVVDGSADHKAILAKPLKNYMNFTMNQAALKFIRDNEKTKDIQVGHPEIS
jgi:hypothetical protein